MGSELEIENEAEEFEEASSDQPTEPKEAGSALPAYLTPGKKLCELREGQGLNRARVGQLLGLTETAVKDLEKNKFENFPGSVYVRGYLKNYARIMGVSEDDIIALYDKYCLDHGLDTGKSTMEPLPESSGVGGTTKIIFGLVILVVVIIGVFVLVGQFA